MNTFSQAISLEQGARKKVRSQIFELNFLKLFLMMGVLLTAFLLVYFKDLNRRSFIEYQNIQQTCQRNEVEWGKLVLLQSTWSTQARIQALAEKQFNMVFPSQKDVVIVEE